MRYLFPVSVLAAFGAALLVGPADAYACGGFFCNATQPVNQAAERIIFAREEDGSVTALIQIRYQGPSERFAWMLPVHGSPEIAVSSNSAFDRLQQASNPIYQLTTTVEGTCREDNFDFSNGPFPAAGAADGGAAREDDPSVMVVNQGSVGPYDFVVISVDPTATNPAQTAVDWLGSEGYDVNDFGTDRLAPYLEGGMNLLAFRLTKGNDAGSIRPVRLGFGAGLPSIPLRPTAVAATDDMGVMVWVLGESRAIPANYHALELNEALINWINPNANYNAVVTRAANEAGGQGFVTEQAGAAGPFADAIFARSESQTWDDIRTADWSAQHGALLQQVLGVFGQHDGMRDVIARHVPVPPGVTRDELLDCPVCFLDLARTRIDGFDPAAFLEAVATEVIEPLEETRALFDAAPYVTRLYTTMSPDEMTVDPIFDFNSELGDVSNQHNADRVIECSPSVFRSEAPFRVVLEDGTVIRGNGRTWPFEVDGPLPANRVIRRIGPEGEGRVVTDNTEMIAAALVDSNARIPGPPAASGCAVSPRPGAGLAGFAGLLGLAGLVVARRRRSRR